MIEKYISLKLHHRNFIDLTFRLALRMNDYVLPGQSHFTFFAGKLSEMTLVRNNPI